MYRSLIAVLAATSLTAPALAENVPAENGPAENVSVETPAITTIQSMQAASPSPLTQFAPAASRTDQRLGYDNWDEALAFIVVPMGPSTRVGMQRPEPVIASRRVYGHTSRFRLEGNRVAFSMVPDEVFANISQYRAELEQLANRIDITALPRNEQLAFWLNLHNVAVVEALAGEYPLSRPEDRRFGTNRAALDDAHLVTIRGVALSPRDIREGIVFANWSDPKVMYGFWRGVIGGPSIQRIAYTADNVDALLSLSAEEFVNSLRGVEAWGGALRVSPIYEEAAQFYFASDDALRTHLLRYARDDVRELVNENPEIRYTRLEGDVADLSLGQRQAYYQPVYQVHCAGTCFNGGAGIIGPDSFAIQTRPNGAIMRLMRERNINLQRARDEGITTGMVIYDDGQYSDGQPAREVE